MKDDPSLNQTTASYLDQQTFSIGEDLDRVTIGYDQVVWRDDGRQHDISRDDLVKIADTMIDRWSRLKEALANG